MFQFPTLGLGIRFVFRASNSDAHVQCFVFVVAKFVFVVLFLEYGHQLFLLGSLSSNLV